MVELSLDAIDLRLLPSSYEAQGLLLTRIPAPILPALRALSAADALDFSQYNNLQPFADHVDALRDANKFAQLMERNQPRPYLCYYFCVLQGAQPQLLGQVGFGYPRHFFAIDVLPHGESAATVSTYVFPSQRGKGYGASMLKAALQLGHKAGLEIIVAGTTPDNTASACTLRAAGMSELPIAPVSSVDEISAEHKLERRFVSKANGKPANEADWPYRIKS